MNPLRNPKRFVRMLSKSLRPHRFRHTHGHPRVFQLPEGGDKIVFRDFKVGEVYKQTIRMTNVSYTFNTFKLRSLTDDIRDFFDIKYKLPGCANNKNSGLSTSWSTPQRTSNISLPCAH